MTQLGIWMDHCELRKAGSPSSDQGHCELQSYGIRLVPRLLVKVIASCSVRFDPSFVSFLLLAVTYIAFFHHKPFC